MFVLCGCWKFCFPDKRHSWRVAYLYFSLLRISDTVCCGLLRVLRRARTRGRRKLFIFYSSRLCRHCAALCSLVCSDFVRSDFGQPSDCRPYSCALWLWRALFICRVGLGDFLRAGLGDISAGAFLICAIGAAIVGRLPDSLSLHAADPFHSRLLRALRRTSQCRRYVRIRPFRVREYHIVLRPSVVIFAAKLSRRLECNVANS